MKTQQEDQQEPSMDEILSSIRRIISDDSADQDDVEEATGKPESGAKAAAASETAPNSVLQPERGEAGKADDDASGDASDGDDDQDVLELTEVVSEGSSVLGFDTAKTQPEPFKPKVFEPKPFEPDPGVKPPWSAGPAGRRARGDDNDAPAAPAWKTGSAEADVKASDDRADTKTDQKGVSSAPAAKGSSAEEPANGTAKQAEQDKAPASPAGSWSAKPSSDDQPQSPTAEARKHDMANQQTAVETSGNGRDGSMPKQAQEAPTGPFAKAPQASQPMAGDATAGERSGRTIEQLAEDMMRPMLSEWLDRNLPPLVEEIVQGEVKKMFRRAQD